MDSWTVVLPICKPQGEWMENIKIQFDTIRTVLPSGTMTDLIIVNDGYETMALKYQLKQLCKQIPNTSFITYAKNKGKGFALREGIRQSKADFIFFTDSDFPFEINAISNLHSKLLSGSDIVIGKREEAYYKKLPKLRRIISKSCILLNKVVLGMQHPDTQAGFKGFNIKGRNLFLNTKVNRYLQDTEFIYLAERNNLNISSVDITLRDNVHFRNMGLGVLLSELKNFYLILARRSKRAANFFVLK